MDPATAIQIIADRIGVKRKVACADFGSYDAAQRGKIWEIEKALMETILGKDWARVWASIAQQPNHISTQNYVLISPTGRNSGEMTTSLTNTLLSELVMRYVDHVTQSHMDFIVEGDDNIFGWDADVPVERFTAIMSRLGFDTKIDFIGDSIDGAQFCKMIYVKSDGRTSAYRELGSLLMKLGWATKQPGKKRDAYLRGKM